MANLRHLTNILIPVYPHMFERMITLAKNLVNLNEKIFVRTFPGQIFTPDVVRKIAKATGAIVIYWYQFTQDFSKENVNIINWTLIQQEYNWITQLIIDLGSVNLWFEEERTREVLMALDGRLRTFLGAMEMNYTQSQN